MRNYASPSGWALAIVAVLVLAADQISKYAVEKFTVAGSTHVLIPGALNLVHTDNPGVAFGLFADVVGPWRAPILIVFALIVICLIAWLLKTDRAGGWLGRCGMTLILAGAAGNVVDRIARDSVTDFIDFYVHGYHWYTFNLADSAIVVGAAMVIFELLRDWRQTAQERA